VARVLLKSADPQVLIQTVDELLAEGEAARHPSTPRRPTTSTCARSARSSSTRPSRSGHRDPVPAHGRLVPGGHRLRRPARIGQLHQRPARRDHAAAGRRPARTRLAALRRRRHHDEILAVAGHRAARPPAPLPGPGRGRCPTRPMRWLNVHVQAIRDEDGERAGFIATVDDVTTLVDADQQRLAAERQHDIDARDRATERLDSLSTLAGGVAHDFNNILGSILAFESFVSESITELTSSGGRGRRNRRGPARRPEQIRKGGQRATGLTQQLLTFGSRKIIDLSALDLNQAICESNALLAPTIGAAHPDRHPPRPGPAPRSRRTRQHRPDPAQPHHQRRQAMPDGGTLTITTPTSTTPTSPRSRRPPADRHVRAADDARQRSRHDTGNPRTRHRTVLHHQGGVASAPGSDWRRSTASSTSSAASCASPPRRRQRHRRHHPPADTTDRRSRSPPIASPPAGGTETILVAEDEDGIRDTSPDPLRGRVHRPAAADGAAALELAAHTPGPSTCSSATSSCPACSATNSPPTCTNGDPRSRSCSCPATRATS
jgi:signal transduction histidine kinase